MICNSAESSIVMIRSSFGIALDRIFRNVVLPEPVPPLINTFILALTSCSINCAASFVMDPIAINCSISIAFSGNFRMVTIGPLFNAIGGNTTFTREPSSKRVSTIGEASFTTRFAFDTICCTTSSNFSLLEKVLCQRRILPPCSMKISSAPFIIISVILLFSTKSCNTSNPRKLWNTSRCNCTFSHTVFPLHSSLSAISLSINSLISSSDVSFAKSICSTTLLRICSCSFFILYSPFSSMPLLHSQNFLD